MGDELVQAINDFGFPIIAAFGLGYFVYYTWNWVVKEIKPVLDEFEEIVDSFAESAFSAGKITNKHSDKGIVKLKTKKITNKVVNCPKIAIHLILIKFANKTVFTA